MKKYILLNIILSFTLFGNTYAQIGINTENPLATVHIDGKGNTTAAGANIDDDVVITSEGNRVKVGLGMIPGSTSYAGVHINTTATGPSPLRIVDGSQGPGKILGTKDTNGNIGWLTPPSSWAKVFNITGPAKNFPNGVGNLLFATQIPETGSYLITIRWWGRADVNYGTHPGRIISAYFFLREGTSNAANHSGDVHKDGIEYYVPYWYTNTPFTFTTFLRADFTAGRWLKIYITPSTPINIKYNWRIGVNGTSTELNPSIVLFKI